MLARAKRVSECTQPRPHSALTDTSCRLLSSCSARGGEHAQPAGPAGGLPQRALEPHLLVSFAAAAGHVYYMRASWRPAHPGGCVVAFHARAVMILLSQHQSLLPVCCLRVMPPAMAGPSNKRHSRCVPSWAARATGMLACLLVAASCCAGWCRLQRHRLPPFPSPSLSHHRLRTHVDTPGLLLLRCSVCARHHQHRRGPASRRSGMRRRPSCWRWPRPTARRSVASTRARTPCPVAAASCRRCARAAPASERGGGRLSGPPWEAGSSTRGKEGGGRRRLGWGCS
jgi:hypothetical protein